MRISTLYLEIEDMLAVIIVLVLCLVAIVSGLGFGTAAGLRFRPSTSTSNLRMADKSFDYLVIGAGSGGMASARRAAAYGAKVGVIEQARLGGTCVNVGCVPKKVMWNAATVNEIIHDANQFGIKVEGKVSFDWSKMKEMRDAYIVRLNGIYSRNLGNSGVEVIEGSAAFSGPKTIQVGDDSITAKHILIAVGGRPYMPDIPGIEHCINSDGFFEVRAMLCIARWAGRAWSGRLIPT